MSDLSCMFVGGLMFGWVIGIIFGLALRWRSQEALSGLNSRLTIEVEARHDLYRLTIRERNAFIAMLDHVYQKQNPGLPMPDWLVMAESYADVEKVNVQNTDVLIAEIEILLKEETNA